MTKRFKCRKQLCVSHWDFVVQFMYSHFSQTCSWDCGWSMGFPGLAVGFFLQFSQWDWTVNGNGEFRCQSRITGPKSGSYLCSILSYGKFDINTRKQNASWSICHSLWIQRWWFLVNDIVDPMWLVHRLWWRNKLAHFGHSLYFNLILFVYRFCLPLLTWTFCTFFCLSQVFMKKKKVS